MVKSVESTVRLVNEGVTVIWRRFGGRNHIDNSGHLMATNVYLLNEQKLTFQD